MNNLRYGVGGNFPDIIFVDSEVFYNGVSIPYILVTCHVPIRKLEVLRYLAMRRCTMTLIPISARPEMEK